MWGLPLPLAVLPITAAPYILGAAGVKAPSQITVELVAIGVLLFGSAANLLGGRALRFLIYIALAAELFASAGIGLTLLIFHRINPLSIIFTAAGTGHGARWLIGPFLLPVAYIAYSFIGFEAAASIGEEVKESRKVLPKAVVLSLARPRSSRCPFRSQPSASSSPTTCRSWRWATSSGAARCRPAVPGGNGGSA